MNSVCVIFHRLGPYHWARLNAASAVFPTLGLELWGESTEYGWDRVAGPGAFRRVTLFPETDARRECANELVERVHKVLEEYQPTAVAIPGWSDRGALAALSWCLKTGTPAIVMSESQESDEQRGWARESIKRRVVRMCSAGLAGGTSHTDYLVALGMSRERVFTGYDVVDNEHFATHSAAARKSGTDLRERMGLPEKYFLASNRFIEKKNLRRLLEAYSGYRNLAGSSSWKLVLLGDGPLKEALTKQINQLGLENDVLLPGFKQYGDLPAYYGLAGAFVHASTVEQWGLVVNEAMACGLPVLVSERCGCASDLVVNGKNGFVFDAFDAQALTKLLLRMAGGELDLQKMGLTSREIISHWSPETFASNLDHAACAARGEFRSKGGMINRTVLHALLQQ